jgi:hypothetical protein
VVQAPAKHPGWFEILTAGPCGRAVPTLSFPVAESDRE